MMEWIDTINSAWSILLEVLTKFNVENIVKLLILAVVMFIFVVAIATIWPLWRSYLSIYDITLINQLDETYAHALLDAPIKGCHVKGSDFMDILPFHCFHIQINPSWRGVTGSTTIHLSVRRADRKSSAVIPIYNSGDIKRSRTFFIEKDGVREISSSVLDVWPWSRKHHFGQTNE